MTGSLGGARSLLSQLWCTSFGTPLSTLSQQAVVLPFSNSIMEAELNPQPCTETAPSTASSYYQPAADPCGPRVPEERHIWPAVSRTPPSRAILQPLSFPETPKEDLSLFTFSCSNFDSLRKSHLSGLAQNLVLSEPKVGHSDVGGALKADNKDVVESGEEEKRVREKEESKVLQLQGGVTPIGAVSRAATGVKIFDRLKMALTA